MAMSHAKVNAGMPVIYEGLDPVTGQERRTWHAAGPNRDEAEKLAQRLAAKSNGRTDADAVIDVRRRI